MAANRIKDITIEIGRGYHQITDRIEVREYSGKIF